MKRRSTQLLILLILCTACTLLPSTNAEPVTISIVDAIDSGFPIYLPSNNVLQLMEIVNSPIVTTNTKDRNCKYLSISFYYENVPYDQKNEPAIKILASDGCFYREWRGYSTKLSWAVGGGAIRVGDEVDKLPPIILFEEPTRQFQYVVFSKESFENTMELLESMKLLTVE
jgi:hypothetical protein